MDERESPPDSDDFGGIGRRGTVAVLIVAALTHPWQTIRELLAAIRPLAARAGRIALAPAGLLATIVLSRRADRRPTFEDHLRSRSDDDS